MDPFYGSASGGESGNCPIFLSGSGFARRPDQAVAHREQGGPCPGLHAQLGVDVLDAPEETVLHEPVETYSGAVRHVVVLDPDRNSLSLAEAPAQ